MRPACMMQARQYGISCVDHSAWALSLTWKFWIMSPDSGNMIGYAAIERRVMCLFQ